MTRPPGIDVLARRDELLAEAADRSRASLRARLERVRSTSRSILQAAFAAAVSWWLARHAVGHVRPFFAPISSIIVLGVTVGQRTRRAAEIVVGVAVGIAVADLVIKGIGTGPAQIAAIVVVAMAAAVLVGGGPLLVTQAATSAVLVATLQASTGAPSTTRFIDALVGGGVALATSSLLLPPDPRALARRAVVPLLEELAAALDDIARALAAHDHEAAERALTRARAVDALTLKMHEAAVSATETARYAPLRRGARGDIARFAAAAPQIELAVRNVRVLARSAIRAVWLGDTVPPGISEAIGELATAARGLEATLERQAPTDEAVAAALRAARLATVALEQTGNLSANMIVGQVRMAAVDLLRALGHERDEARDAVFRAASSSAAGAPPRK